MHKELNLSAPKTYNEKLQWLKLYDRKPEYSRMVDKAEAKNFVANIIGQQHIIPTLGIWEKFDDIDFEQLPDKFVLKTTHGCGGVIICKDKTNLIFKKPGKRLNLALSITILRMGESGLIKMLDLGLLLNNLW
jgi:hypothetical protein